MSAQKLSLLYGLMGLGYFDGMTIPSNRVKQQPKENICRCGKSYSHKKRFCSSECCKHFERTPMNVP